METQARSHTLVRLQIDELKPKRVTALAIVLIFLLGLFFIFSAVVPSPLMQISPTQDTYCITNLNQFQSLNNSCYSTFDLYNSPIYMNRVFNASGLNQLIYATAVLQRSNLTGVLTDFYLNLNFQLSVYELSNPTTISQNVVDTAIHNVSIHCGNGQNFCDETTVVLIPELKYSNYLIIIQVLNPTQYQNQLNGGYFNVNMIANSYSNFLLGLRYTFCCVSMITCFLYLWRMRSLRMFRDWIIEQKAILVLSFLLILFNNPFYALVIAVPGEASFLFSTLFSVNFAVFLFAFWWTTYQRIRLENQQKNTKTLTIWKILFLILLWVFTLTSLLILNHFYLQDPGFDFDTEHQSSFLAFKILAIIFSVFALLALLREIVYIIQHFQTRIWRQKLLFVLSSFFIFAFFVFIFSGAFASFNENGSRVLLAIALMNLYIFVLQLLYIPTEKGIRETQQIERNENERPDMQYDVLEDNINIEFNSPYNDQGIQMQQPEGEIELSQPSHSHDLHDHHPHDQHAYEHNDEESHEKAI